MKTTLSTIFVMLIMIIGKNIFVSSEIKCQEKIRLSTKESGTYRTHSISALIQYLSLSLSLNLSIFNLFILDLVLADLQQKKKLITPLLEL